MGFSWYGGKVKQAIKESKQEVCEKWGTLIESEYKSRTPVVSGNMKAHETHQVHDDGNGVDIGTTPEAEYAIDVELGTSKQKAQHILEGVINDNLDKISDVASRIISSKIGN